ncbi:MAG: transposase [Paludibacteraceae bacterium]|nr:transposase [Paludibacteraceae bacterium]
MAYKKGEERHQVTLFPAVIDEYVEQDSPVRLFDAFVDHLNLCGLGFQRTTAAIEGRPGFDPRDMIKLYIYGYFYQIRSSRRLARECKCNIEVMWLLGKLTPDFRTIAEFRKNNAEPIVKVFREFNRFCINAKIISRSYISIDGSKFQAVNSLERNYNLKKIDARIQQLNEQIPIYIKELDESDDDESGAAQRAHLQTKINKRTQEKSDLENMRKQMLEEGKQQVSLTDKDAKLMGTRKGFVMAYNTQTAVDAESHMIVDFDHTTDPVDLGHLTSIAKKAKDILSNGEDAILSTVSDTGYESLTDQANALANGIIPNVIRRNHENTTEVSFNYHKADINDATRASINPQDLRKCLEAGVIPDAYKEILSDATISNVYTGNRWHDVCDEDVTHMSVEQMQEKAKQGYFIRNAEVNCVYCPSGCILYPIGNGKNGLVSYRNTMACAHCPMKCKDIKSTPQPRFPKDQLVRPVDSKQFRDGQKQQYIGEKTTSQRITYRLHLDIEKMKKRMSISEHPFGTLKRALGQYYFLLKGLTKTTTEMAMFCLSYNLKRAIQLRGVNALMAMLVVA